MMKMAEKYEIQLSRKEYSGISFGKLDLVMVAVIFLQSLLIAWFMFLLLDAYEVSPIFRFLQGIAILFAILVPVFIVIEGFRYSSITAGFFIPLALYAFMFPLFNSLIRHINLFLDPAIIIPAIIGGLGFGLIGLGAYHLKNNVSKTFALVTAGITIIFLSTPMILAGFLYVLTGDLSSFPALFS
jgi:hypothetical protein